MSDLNLNKQGFVLGTRLYDQVKFIVTIFFPALATFYAAVAGLWGFPNVQPVVGTITALSLFLGLLIGISSKNFSSQPITGTPVGKFVVQELPDGKKTVSLAFDRDPADFVQDDVISFHLDNQPVSDDVENREENLP